MREGRIVLRIHFTPRDLARVTVATALHPRVRWVAPVLQVLDMNDRDLYLDGRGIELQPSAFCRQVPTKLRDPELKPVLVYPIQHAPGILRQASMESAPRSDPLGSLLGSTRAVALEAAVSGCTTTELAKRCNISPAAASHQATVLREAGLITTRRAAPPSATRSPNWGSGCCPVTAPATPARLPPG
ncbi:winged helix-turn-helix domain-containing protein [Kribbella sp. NBC_01484]|uniref:winged helix-turn-helix domain-containing protein n=1 Tax=Kribbella sp. NBC_01484 TaxID=2903579 RepID=UPI002E350F2B|nr:winged helix-turn-helix domain-containing protein [Kribbella sp. NBC_01484]